jgi:RimJ/RimL family protein N-acetyltransferase
MILETERLLLRPWRPEDLEPFAALNQDPEVMRFFPAPLTPEESRARMEGARAHFDRHGWGCWAVERKGGPAFIGFIALGEPRFQAPFTPCIEVGWRLARDQWGRGLAPEGARAALGCAFGTLGLAEVVSFTAAVNQPSRRVMEKLGMVRDPGEDFLHPLLPPDHPLALHVLYRVTARAWVATS